jgi:hypothetical protein
MAVFEYLITKEVRKSSRVITSMRQFFLQWFAVLSLAWIVFSLDVSCSDTEHKFDSDSEHKFNLHLGGGGKLMSHPTGKEADEFFYNSTSGKRGETGPRKPHKG